MNSTPPLPRRERLAEFREQLAEVERQLLNPKLFQIVRQQLDFKAELLRLEISELETPTRWTFPTHPPKRREWGLHFDPQGHD